VEHPYIYDYALISIRIIQQRSSHYSTKKKKMYGQQQKNGCPELDNEVKLKDKLIWTKSNESFM
jgi:hypothetical protein